MTKEQIEAVLGRVLTWPVEKQVLAARLLLSIEAQDDRIYELDAEEEADLRKAMAEMDRGEVASDAEVKALFRRRG
jgi:hypothetical protein